MPRKFKGLVVPYFPYGTMGEMQAACLNVRSMDGCGVLKCSDCLFDADNKRKHQIFRAWKKSKSAVKLI